MIRAARPHRQPQPIPKAKPDRRPVIKTTALLAAIVLSTAVTGAQAQSSRQSSAVSLPKGCQAAAQASGQLQILDKTKADMDRGMQSAMQGMGHATETQKGLHQAMMAMNPAMMQGMMAKDADVAWICAMIPHHQGAIDMARAGLAGADNAESKRMAEETIKMQQQEIAKLTAWVDKHAEQERRNESTGANPR